MAPGEHEFDNGNRVVPCVVVKTNGDGTWDIHAAEGDSDAVKLFLNVQKDANGRFHL